MNAKRVRPVIVVKLGSNALVRDDGILDKAFLRRIAKQVALACKRGWRPVIVSSGAVAAGRSLLPSSERTTPRAISERQALAAIGQADLIHQWQQALARHGLVGAQVLLTADDFDDRERYVNLTATFRALFEHGVVPIVNENDAVSVAELTLGDNDRLSAQVAMQLHADRLLLLTDVDGFYDAHPDRDPTARRIDHVERITPKLMALAGGSSERGTGGMRSKLEAARLATRAGVAVQIAAAREKRVIDRLLAGEPLGTSFAAGDVGSNQTGKRRWLAMARRCKGSITLDEGACRALLQQGRSLLPVGVQGVTGSFRRGDTVALLDAEGAELAHGLCNLSAEELQAIKGLRWDAAVEKAGYALPKTAVHRDHILLLD